MNTEQAETIALQALAWVLSDDDMTQRFFGVSGAEPTALRDRAGDADVLCAVMDFILMDDRTVLDFAGSVGMPAETVAVARYSLPGGEQVHWT